MILTNKKTTVKPLMKTTKMNKTTSGFTMIEIVIVLAILSITATFAVPRLSGWLENNRLKLAARELYSNMQKAKSEALKRNCSIGVTFSTVTFPAQGGGYKIFLDNGSGTAGNATLDPGETILLQVGMPQGCTLYKANFSAPATATPTSSTGFNSRGLLLQKNNWVGNGSVELRNNNSVWYKMSLSNSGYPKIRKSYDGTNWH